QPHQGRSPIPPVKEVIQAFPHRRDSCAFRKFEIQEGAVQKLRRRHTTTRQSDHVRRQIDTQHSVTSLNQPARPQTTAATQVNHQPSTNATASKQSKQSNSRLLGELAESPVVYVGEILLIRFRFHCELFEPQSVASAHGASIQFHCASLDMY